MKQTKNNEMSRVEEELSEDELTQHLIYNENILFWYVMK